MLYKFVEGYTADYTAKNRCIALYTDTHCVTALHSYTATIQLHSAIHYTAIQRYTLYNLYNTPLLFQGDRPRVCTPLNVQYSLCFDPRRHPVVCIRGECFAGACARGMARGIPFYIGCIIYFSATRGVCLFPQGQ